MTDRLTKSVLESEDRRLRRLAARGALPLPPEELLPLQLRLLDDEDSETADSARESLESLGPQEIRALLAVDVDPQVVGALVGLVRSAEALVELIRYPAVPVEPLVERAPRLKPEAQEALLLRQDLIVSMPAILDALELNPSLDAAVRRKLGEYREHLVPQAMPKRKQREAETVEEATDEEVEVAIAEALQHSASGERDPETGLSESQIRMLPVPVKLRMCRGAKQSTRWILLRDSNPQVALTAFQRAPLGGNEVEQLAMSRSVATEVLEEIAKDRRWSRRYVIMQSLVKNPRTPISVSVQLVPRLAMRDLRTLSRDRNVPDAVRTRAASLYRMRFR